MEHPWQPGQPSHEARNESRSWRMRVEQIDVHFLRLISDLPYQRQIQSRSHRLHGNHVRIQSAHFRKLTILQANKMRSDRLVWKSFTEQLLHPFRPGKVFAVDNVQHTDRFGPRELKNLCGRIGAGRIAEMRRMGSVWMIRRRKKYHDSGFRFGLEVPQD